MNLYPAFLNLENMTALVTGAGKVAERKIRGLLECGAQVVCIGPEATEAIQSMNADNRIVLIPRKAETDDLFGGDNFEKPQIVFLCANEPDTQRRLSKACREAGIWFNAADAPDESAFHTGAVLRRGSLQAAISTGGESPGLARRLREELEQKIDWAYGAFTRLCGEIRRADMAAGIPMAQRSRRLRKLLDSGLLEVIREQGEDAGRTRANEILNQEN